MGSSGSPHLSVVGNGSLSIIYWQKECFHPVWDLPAPSTMLPPRKVGESSSHLCPAGANGQVEDWEGLQPRDEQDVRVRLSRQDGGEEGSQG